MAGPATATMLHLSLSMTIDAPRHPHRRDTSDTVHCLHRAMTFLAREARLDVTFVRKVNVVGNIVNLYPRYWFLVFPVGGQLEDFGTVTNAGY